MATHASQTVAVPRPRAATLERASSSVGFDWLMGLLAVLVMAGVIQDGWAHNHGKVDQSFLTPWHAILYASMALNGIVLGAVAVRNKLQGYAARAALPYGYGLALGGVILFALGGAFDLVWHTVFGIETDINALLSPSHLVLALGAVLVFTGPLRSVARQYGPDRLGWRLLGPVVLALTAIVTMLGFFTSYAQPIADSFTTATVAPDSSGPLVASLYAVDPRSGAQARLPVPQHLDPWGISIARDGRIAYRAQTPHAATTSAQPPSDVYVAAAGGESARRITHSGRHDTQVAWSPDAAQLAYISLPAGTAGNFSLHVIRADGSGDRTLVDGTTTLSAPAWSPDGARIAYGTRSGLNDTIAVVDVGSGNSTRLAFAKDAGWPAWSGPNRIAFATSDGAIREAGLDGSDPTVLVSAGAGEPAFSPDGKQLAYTAKDGGATQVFVADRSGAHARDVTQLPGVDASRPAWTPDGRIAFTATGRPSTEHTPTGFSLAEAASLLQAVMLAGVLLLALRRWRAPAGAFTLMLVLFAFAMATQSDAYYDVVPALVTGIVIDVAVFVLGARARTGVPFYVIGFALPALFFTAYLVATSVATGGTAWTPDMLLGSPLLAGIAGLLVAFCYEPPLPAARDGGAA
jgi:Tol biopolymer transport system component